MNTIIGIVSILLFHGIWKWWTCCHLFSIHNNQSNHIIIGKYSTWWFYFYYSLILSLSTHLFPILFNNIIYQSTVLSAIMILLSIWIILSKWYWYQTSFQILVRKWNMKEYYLQQSSILSIIDLHLISKNRWNIYSFIHIHTNTSDWFGFDIFKWIRKIDCLKIRNIYSWFNHSISN